MNRDKNKSKLPVLGERPRKGSMSTQLNGKEYLALARQLKENQQEILFEGGKENIFMEEEGE